MNAGAVGDATASAWTPGPAWLFCPADRPDRYAKAAERSDVAIIDLEDAVAPERKAAARDALAAAYGGLDPDRTLVRINAASTPEHALDLDLVGQVGIHRIMLAKTESPADLTGLADREVIALLESPRGIQAAGEILQNASVIGAMWGAEDLIAGLGGTSSRDETGAYRPVAVHAQTATLLAAKAAGKLAVDAVHLAITDHDGLRRESEAGVASGFDAKALIHPAHVDIVRAAYTPEPEQVTWAQRVLDGEKQHGSGVFALDGQMVDGPVLAQARRVIARAAAAR